MSSADDDMYRVQCIVCNERFNNAIMMPCRHVFCAKCVKDAVVCPFCGTEGTSSVFAHS